LASCRSTDSASKFTVTTTAHVLPCGHLDFSLTLVSVEMLAVVEAPAGEPADSKEPNAGMARDVANHVLHDARARRRTRAPAAARMHHQHEVAVLVVQRIELLLP